MKRQNEGAGVADSTCLAVMLRRSCWSCHRALRFCQEMPRKEVLSDNRRPMWWLCRLGEVKMEVDGH